MGSPHAVGMVASWQIRLVFLAQGVIWGECTPQLALHIGRSLTPSLGHFPSSWGTDPASRFLELLQQSTAGSAAHDRNLLSQLWSHTFEVTASSGSWWPQGLLACDRLTPVSTSVFTWPPCVYTLNFSLSSNVSF